MLLPGPPRQIPLALQVKSILGSALSLTGWFGLLAAALLIIAGIKGSDPYSLQKDPEKIPHTHGKIATVKAYKSSKNSGFYYYYNYLIQGKTYQGRFVLQGEQKYSVNQGIEVAYLADHPEQSVIPEHAPEAFNRFAEFAVMLGMSLLCGLFGLACIGMIVMAAYDGWCDLRLLKMGTLEQAKILSLDTSQAGLLSVQYQLHPEQEARTEVFSNQRDLNQLSHLKADSEIPVIRLEKDSRALLSLLPNQNLSVHPLWLSCLLIPPGVFFCISFMWFVNP